ncbi:protein serine/threonine kinase [Pelomyxa schiedti]|nr:protein serine/threonine kinase [Pelomyxa schiedti]
MRFWRSETVHLLCINAVLCSICIVSCVEFRGPWLNSPASQTIAYAIDTRLNELVAFDGPPLNPMWRPLCSSPSYGTLGDIVPGTGNFYIIDDWTNSLVSMSLEDCTTTQIGSTGIMKIAALTWASKPYNTLFAIARGLLGNFLYTIDISSGKSSKIGLLPDFGPCLGLAYDAVGQALYTLSVDEDALYKVAPNATWVEKIGPIGYDVDTQASLHFDVCSADNGSNTSDLRGVLYLAAYNPSCKCGEMRVVNADTGASTLVSSEPDPFNSLSFLNYCNSSSSNSSSSDIMSYAIDSTLNQLVSFTGPPLDSTWIGVCLFQHAPQSGEIPISAPYVGDIMYYIAASGTDNLLYSLHLSNCTSSVVGITGTSGQITGMSYSSETGQMYIVEVPTIGSSNIYTVALDSGFATKKTSLPFSSASALAVDVSYFAYTINTEESTLWKCHIYNWSCGAVGKLGYTTQDAQSLHFDICDNNTLFLAAYTSDSTSQLRTVNVLTGESTFVATEPHPFIALTFLRYCTEISSDSTVDNTTFIIELVCGCIGGLIFLGLCAFLVVIIWRKSSSRPRGEEYTPITSSISRRIRGVHSVPFPLTFSVDKITLGLHTNNAPVEQPLSEEVLMTNQSPGKVLFSITYENRDQHTVTVSPRTGTLSAGGTTTLKIAVTFHCTTRAEIKISVNTHSSTGDSIGYLSGRIDSTLSTRLDYEELILKVPAIGDGSYGIVYAGTWRGNDVAIKVLRYQNLDADSFAEFKREILMMEAIRSNYCVNFIGAVTVPGKYCIVTEFCAFGSLSKVMREYKLAYCLRMKMASDAARGMQYLHSNGIIHRDLKPDNLLVTSLSLDTTVNCKITDFGTTREINVMESKNRYTLGVGTVLYQAPELIENQMYSPSCDIFSYAVLLYELYIEKEPYPNTEFKSFFAVTQFILTGQRRPIPETCPSDLASLIADCWAQDPLQRPTFQEVETRMQTVLQEAHQAHSRDSPAAIMLPRSNPHSKQLTHSPPKKPLPTPPPSNVPALGSIN